MCARHENEKQIAQNAHPWSRYDMRAYDIEHNLEDIKPHQETKQTRTSNIYHGV